MNIYRESVRRLSDGIHIRVSPVVHHRFSTKLDDDWVHINITAMSGQPLYTGTMRIWEALAEVPYQIDRAREFDRYYAEKGEG